MQIIKAVNKAIIENGLSSIRDLISLCGISYAGAIAILNENGEAKLSEVMAVLNYIGLTLKIEKVA